MSVSISLDNMTEQLLSSEAKQLGISIEFLILQFIQQGMALKKQTNVTVPVTKQRILGLHQGQGWVSEDFDEPLPDSFWLGEDV